MSEALERMRDERAKLQVERDALVADVASREAASRDAKSARERVQAKRAAVELRSQIPSLEDELVALDARIAAVGKSEAERARDVAKLQAEHEKSARRAWASLEALVEALQDAERVEKSLGARGGLVLIRFPGVVRALLTWAKYQRTRFGGFAHARKQHGLG